MKRIGAPTAANPSCQPRLPNAKPSQGGRCHSTRAMTTTKGRRRVRVSGHIHAQLSGIRVMMILIGAIMEFEVYYDYLCPFVYRASLLLAKVGDERSLEIRWSYFSLTQVNSKDEGWTVWDAAAGERVRGRTAF